MTDIISYRLSANGTWGYSYYQNETLIGKTTCLLQYAKEKFDGNCSRRQQKG